MPILKDRSKTRADTPPAIEPVPYDVVRPMVASSARVRLNSKPEIDAMRQRASTAAGWQKQAWQCYNYVGEVNYAFNYSASILSRVRFHPAVVVAPDAPPIEIRNATRVTTDANGSTAGTVGGIDPRLARYATKVMRDFAGRGGIAPKAKAFALNTQVAGECYMCQIGNEWQVKSTMELRIDAGNRAVLYESRSTTAIPPRKLKAGTPVGRIWNQHPEYSADPDSSLAAVITDCEELILLSRLMRVVARARLNAGILFVPDDISAAARIEDTPDDEDSEDQFGDEDDEVFEKELFDTMTAPVADEDNAAALVPMLIRGPGDSGNQIKYIQLSREIGRELAARSADVLNRVLQGINAPKEQTTGLSGSRYNNAQLIDEQSYKALVEPLALMFSDAVTDIVLRPILRAAAQTNAELRDIPDIAEQVERVIVWYDPSEVVTSVDQSQAANEGHTRNVLSDAAWRRANGFSDTDAPSENELAVRLALSQVAIPPDVQQALLRIVMPTIFKKAQEESQSANGAGTQMPPELAETLESRGPGEGDVAPSPPVPASSVPPGV